MTKKIVAVLALSLVASSAFASQAKNIVTGAGDGGLFLSGNGMGGSFYTNDEYNIFWNPAFINGQKNWAIIENGVNSGTSAGFVTDMSNLNVGVFFNRPNGSIATNGGQAVDVVVGGDMGFKWGVGLTQTLSQDASAPASTTRLKAGVVMGDFEPFISYDLKNSTGGAAEVKSEDMMVGTRYHYGDWTPYVAYRMAKAVSTQTDSTTHLGLGLGRMAKMGDLSMMYSLGYFSATTGNAKAAEIPLELTIQGDAASWLTARAGFKHDIRSFGSATAATSTTLGGSFHMGKADLDMVVGQTTQAFGFGSTDLFANAGLVYRW